MKKSRVTQELANFFPTWSKVRNDDQSIGYTFLNTLAQPMDGMDHYLHKMNKNQYLSTVNLDEIDWVYKVKLPETYTFSTDTTDPLSPKYIAPTVQGLVINNTQSGYVSVSLAENNDLESFWYDALPTRVDLEETVSGYEVLASLLAEDMPVTGMMTHHLAAGGRISVNVSSGTQYISVNDRGNLDRAKIIIRGTTRKGSEETETMVFPWNLRQYSLKEWKEITSFEAYNFEDDVKIDLRSADFDWGPYMSFYNFRWSDIDTKIDEFWDLGLSDTGYTTIDMLGYISDEWQTLLLGFSDLTEKNRWELLDSDWQSVRGIDLAIQPFTERAWVISDDRKLHCYSIEETMVSGIDFLSGRTSGSNVRLEFEDKHVMLGEDIKFTPLHIRPLKSINRYRIWYRTPSGTKYGLLAGSQVAFSSNFWVYPLKLERQIESQITFSAAERGEYLFVLEVELSDGTTHTDKVIIPVQTKFPLTTIDIDTLIPNEVVSGLDFDADQHLWVKTDKSIHRFSLHSDLMLIDYEDKVIYFREPYEDVEIS